MSKQHKRAKHKQGSTTHQDYGSCLRWLAAQDEWKESTKDRSLSCVRGYLHYLDSCYGVPSLRFVSREVLLRSLDEYSEHFGKAAMRTFLSSLRSYLKYACRVGYLDKSLDIGDYRPPNPFELVTEVGVYQGRSPKDCQAEVDEFLSNEESVSPRDLLSFSCIYHSGVSPSVLVGVRIEQLTNNRIVSNGRLWSFEHPTTKRLLDALREERIGGLLIPPYVRGNWFPDRRIPTPAYLPRIYYRTPEKSTRRKQLVVTGLYLLHCQKALDSGCPPELVSSYMNVNHRTYSGYPSLEEYDIGLDKRFTWEYID